MIAISETNPQPAQKVYALTEKLLDDRIREAELSELKMLLTNSAKARRAYVEMMLLQAHLYSLSKQKKERWP